MKRLTIRNSDGTVSQPTHSTFENVFTRLAEYEDTGLEPDEILSGKELAEVACALISLKEYKSLGTIDHIRDLLKAEQDGRLAVLPCKVGDTVYYPSVKQTRCTAHGENKDDDMCCGCEEKCDASTEPYIFSGEVARVEIIGDDVILVRCRFKEKYDNAGYVIGKTVFLTRKEAEAALAMEGGNQ